MLDTQLERLGISPDGVLGYSNEACTHTEIANAIHLGQAQVGLGIHAARLPITLGSFRYFQNALMWS